MGDRGREREREVCIFPPAFDGLCIKLSRTSSRKHGNFHIVQSPKREDKFILALGNLMNICAFHAMTQNVLSCFYPQDAKALPRERKFKTFSIKISTSVDVGKSIERNSLDSLVFQN